jgi:hypothetical protein
MSYTCVLPRSSFSNRAGLTRHQNGCAIFTTAQELKLEQRHAIALHTQQPRCSSASDEHGCAVHHRNVHSTHSRLTQTTPFADWPTLALSADEHGRAVHHGTAQSAQLTDTQTSPFADRLTAVCRHALFPPKLPRRSALLHWLCRPSTEDRPTYRSPPLYHRYYLNTLILPTSLPIRLRSTTN